MPTMRDGGAPPPSRWNHGDFYDGYGHFTITHQPGAPMSQWNKFKPAPCTKRAATALVILRPLEKSLSRLSTK